MWTVVAFVERQAGRMGDEGMPFQQSLTGLLSGCFTPHQFTGVSKACPAKCRVALSTKRTTEA